MNYNPYYYTPYMNMGAMNQLGSVATKSGIFSSLFKGARGINWSGILSGTGKVLNIANQAIPVIKQVGPVMNNAKTMFRVMNEFKKVDTPTKTVTKENVRNDSVNVDVKEEKKQTEFTDIGPTFFL